MGKKVGANARAVGERAGTRWACWVAGRDAGRCVSTQQAAQPGGLEERVTGGPGLAAAHHRLSFLAAA